jgi:hypothetical protein
MLVLHIQVYFIQFGKFNEAVRSSDYIATNNKIISELRNVKDVEDRGRGLIQGTLPAFDWRD